MIIEHVKCAGRSGLCDLAGALNASPVISHDRKIIIGQISVSVCLDLRKEGNKGIEVGEGETKVLQWENTAKILLLLPWRDFSIWIMKTT